MQLEEDKASDSEDEIRGKTRSRPPMMIMSWNLGDDFVCPDGVTVHDKCPSGGASEGMIIYYRYDNGWSKSTVKRRVEHSLNRSLNGLWATLYEDGEFFNDLDPVNYGDALHWVAVQ